MIHIGLLDSLIIYPVYCLSLAQRPQVPLRIIEGHGSYGGNGQKIPLSGGILIGAVLHQLLHPEEAEK